MSAVVSPAVSNPLASSCPVSIEELDEQIRGLARGMNAECYRMLMLVREFDDRLGYAKWSFQTCAEWLSWSCDITLSAAREKVRTAQALRHLPAISAAFADGRLSYTKARALTRVALDHDEDLLLAYALRATAAQVEERCRQIRNVLPGSVQNARRAWETRALSLWRNEARETLRLTVELPIEEGELISRAIDCAIAAGEVAVGVEPNTIVEPSKRLAWQAQQADAFVAIVKAYLDGGGAAKEESSTADRYQVAVHVDEKALRGGAGRADLPIETIRRLCCDGSVVAVVDGDDGAPLDVGRKQRIVSTALRRALHARDRGCTFPGCHRKHYTDAHHLRHWVDGGETTRDNLTLLCTYHHRLLHEGRFRVERAADGALMFRRPDERVIPRCGYRIEDFTDDFDDSGSGGSKKPSAEGCDAYSRNSAMEVREPAAVYAVN